MQAKRPEWNGNDPDVIEAIRRHMARRPEPPTVDISATTAQYNRAWGQYNAAFAAWEDDTRAAWSKLGGVSFEDIFERNRK